MVSETRLAARHDLYRNRRLSEGYPDMGRLAFEAFSADLDTREDETPAVERLLVYLNRLIDLEGTKRIVVIGCGPKPQLMRILLNKGHQVVGIEPVTSFVQSAANYLNAPAAVIEGAAEQMPLPDESQDVVMCVSVMEHVDSAIQSIQEMFRVLVPGGIAYITTTNWLAFSPTGYNAEYHVPFYNWFPELVKECYVFHHLHYAPHLANYTQRPAVHWYSYSRLCKVGRDAGFAQFYSVLDLARSDDPTIARSRLRTFLLNRLQQNPWLRALALSQIGGSIIMYKRA